MRNLTQAQKMVLADIISMFVKIVPRELVKEHRELVHLAVAELLVTNICAIDRIPFNERLIAECADQCIYTLRTGIIPRERANFEERGHDLQAYREAS